MRPDIVPGAVFPDYELSDQRGKHRVRIQFHDPCPTVFLKSAVFDSVATIEQQAPQGFYENSMD